MSKTENIISIKNLTYKKIINNISLNVKKDSITSISGTNCSGKTTLIKLIGGIIGSTKSIYINDVAIEDINKTELFKNIGIYIAESSEKYEFESLKEGIFYTLTNLNLEQSEQNNLYKEIINITKIKNIIEHNPNNITRIETIKFHITLLLLCNPQVLLLDNILAGLTKKEKKEIISILKYIQKNKDMTIIMTTNDLTDTIESDYIYILNEGQIELEGPPIEVLKNDSKINKLGLDIPFMIDLSVKLSDYDILDSIILDIDRMIDKLWK